MVSLIKLGKYGTNIEFGIMYHTPIGMSVHLMISPIICPCHPSTSTIKLFRGGLLSQIESNCKFDSIHVAIFFYSTRSQTPEFKIGTKSVDIFVSGTLTMSI